MAFDTYQEPTNTLQLGRSPIIVVAGDPAITDENYRVVVRVYAWEGDPAVLPSNPIATLDKIQDSSGRAKFNIGPIVEDLFVPNDPRVTTATVANGQGICYNLYLDVGWKNGGAFNSVDTVGPLAVTAGYGLYPDDINSFDDAANYINSRNALTVRPRDGVIVKENPAWISVFWTGVSGADAVGLSISGTDNDGDPQTTAISFSTGGGTPFPTDSTKFIVRQRIDATYLDQTLDYNTDLPITVTINGSGTDDVFTLNFKNDLCEVGSDCIAFVNRFGVWDWLHCYAVQRKGIEVDRIEYQSRVSEYNDSDEVTYDRFNPSNKVLRSRGTTTYEVSTGWITEAHNPLIQDMFLSKIWYSFNLTIALLLVDKQVQFKRDGDTELMNYTFRFKVANNAIQDVQ